MKGVSAYVPCFNNARTVARALTSIHRQTIPIDQIFLVDDASTDSSRAVADQLGVRVVTLEHNLGRGAVRALALDLAKHPLVLCCDATNYLPEDFMLRASHWFADPNVAAVFGRIWQSDSTCLSDRWRGRHLFKVDQDMKVQHRALLSTYGCVLRKDYVIMVGNFDPSLRHSEDADLGHRLLDAGLDVVFDPNLYVVAGVSNTILEVLERYWRWYAGKNEDISLREYAKKIWFSFRVMALLDLRDGDFLSVPISLFVPHYQFWRSWLNRCSSRELFGNRGLGGC